MKTKKVLLTLVILATTSVLAWAQSGNILAQTRTWNTVKGIDLVSLDSVNVEMEFKSFSSDRIEHKGSSGLVQVFDITGTEGTWMDISQTGSMTYQVSINSANGLMLIERTSGGVFLTVDMSGAGGGKMKFIISSIE